MPKAIKKIRGRGLHAKLKTTIRRTGGKRTLFIDQAELEIENKQLLKEQKAKAKQEGSE